MTTGSAFSQRELAKGILNGDKIILQEVAIIILPKIKGMLVKRNANFQLLEQKAEDIFQDALCGFLVAVKRNKYEEKGKFLSFFMQIAANAASNNYHNKQKCGEDAIGGYAASGESIDYIAAASSNYFDTFQEDAPDLHELIDKDYALPNNQYLLKLVFSKSATLKPKPKAVFNLWLEGYSLAKTAELLNLSVGNVKVIRSRVRQRLKKLCA